jgi:hypothetical protein
MLDQMTWLCFVSTVQKDKGGKHHLTRWGCWIRFRRVRQSSERSLRGRRRAGRPSRVGSWNRARACWRSAVRSTSAIVFLSKGTNQTYVIPDRHDEDHGLRNSLVDGREASDLTEAVTVTENGELVLAVIRGDGARGGQAIVLGTGDLDLLAVLDEELGESILLKLGNNTVRWSVGFHETISTEGTLKCLRLREFLAGVYSLSLAVEVRVTHAVWVIVAAVGVTVASKAIVGVGTAAVLVFADVVCVVLATVRGEGERVGVRFPSKVMLIMHSSPCHHLLFLTRHQSRRSIRRTGQHRHSYRW